MQPRNSAAHDEEPRPEKRWHAGTYGAHADRRELNRWIDAVAESDGSRKPPVCLVHGEPPSQEALESQLSQRGYKVRIPAPGDEVKF